MTIDIAAAQARIQAHTVRTPLLNAPLLDAEAGRRIFVKAECLQKTGSFKYRGARSAISALAPDTRAKGVIAYSSGNHAQGVACAARELQTPATIIMPADAPQLKIANTRAYGAEVVLYDRATEDRDAIGTRLAQSRDLTLIKPFDNTAVISGQGTCGVEIAEQATALGITRAPVLIPCGGGGLTAGVALALAEHAPGLTPHPVEPVGFDDVARSLASGAIQTNPTQTGSIADAILTPSPGQITFPVLKAQCGPGYAVSDDEALRAVALAFKRLKIVVEPGAAVALAAALWHLEGDGDVIVICSGGNVDAEVFREALGRWG